MARKKAPLHAGIDVSAYKLTMAWEGRDDEVHVNEFANNDEGHRQLIRLLGVRRPWRVVVEATSSYHIDLCVALEAAKRAVMVANPLATRKFADAHLLRAKTDKVDARMLLEFARRMEFEAWVPPTAAILNLRDFARRLCAVNVELTREKNRRHAARAKSNTPPAILADIEASIASLNARVDALTRAAADYANSVPELREAMAIATSVPGIAERSAVRILGELLPLAEDMEADQVVAHAGLDPAPHQSGSSVRGRQSISKKGNSALRGALFMPVLTAVQHAPTIRAAYEALLARGKLPLVAQTAIARRLLRVLWVMLRTKTTFNPAKFGTAGAKTTAAA